MASLCRRSRRLPHQPRFGAAGSSDPEVEITGTGGEDDDGDAGALSPPNGAGSRIVERRRAGSCVLAGGAKVQPSVEQAALSTGANSGRAFKCGRRDPGGSHAASLARIPFSSERNGASPLPLRCRLRRPPRRPRRRRRRPPSRARLRLRQSLRTRLRLVEIVFLGRARLVILVAATACSGAASCGIWCAPSRGSPPRPRPPRPRRRLRRRGPSCSPCLATLLAFGFGRSDLGIFGRFGFGFSLILLESSAAAR